MRPARSLITAFVLLLAPLSLARSQDAASPPPWWQRLRIFGDFRLRGEGFYQSGQSSRTRPRIRLRLGLIATITPEWEVGTRFATGTEGNITSTNQSLDDAFETKSFRLDHAYVRYNPTALFGATRRMGNITAGKFGVQDVRPGAVMRSELVLDDDLSPEGFHETVIALDRTSGVLRRLEVHGDQWVVEEVSNGADAWTLGGQLAATIAPSATTSLVLAAGVSHLTQPDLLARARNGNGELVITNDVELQDGTIVRSGLPFAPSAANPIVGFADGFTLLRASAELTVQTANPSRPVTAYVDWVHNTAADDARDGAWVGVGLGRLRRPGDWTLSAVYARTEREATISPFSYSDLGRSGGTNQHGVFVQAEWRVAPGVTFSAKEHAVRFITLAPGIANPTLHRVQVNAGFAF